LFHAFPDGRSGFGLLLLRVAVAIVGIVLGAGEITSHAEPGFGNYVRGVIGVAGGVSLVLGLLTPVAAVAIDAAVLWMGLRCRLCFGLLLASTVSLLLQGPGAFSLDARLFGWREIIIPPSRPND